MDLRFLDAGEGRALYESVYSVLASPDGRQALWTLTTVRKRPGEQATGALWTTWTSGTEVRAAKLDGLPAAPGGHGITVGDATQGEAGSRGSIDLPSLSATWDVTFTSGQAPLEHLRPAWLYRAPLPRTKPTSPVPDLGVTGSLEIEGAEIDLTGWTGMLGHNWGSEHAARWIWLRAAGLGDDGTGWLDAVLARVRVGPVLTPWTAFGSLSLDGTRRTLGGLGSRGTRVELGTEGAVVTMSGVVTTVHVDRGRTVAWQYADPTGGEHEVVNCSVAEVTVEVDGHALPARSGVLEVGGDERAFDVPLQDFPD